MKLKNFLKLTSETKIHYIIMNSEKTFVEADFVVDYVGEKNITNLNHNILQREFYLMSTIDNISVDPVVKCMEIRCHI